MIFSVMRRVSAQPWMALYVFAAVSLVLTPAIAFLDMNNLMVHPHSPTEHLARLLTRASFSIRDFIAPFQEYDHRARFATYFVTLVDYRARVFLYGFIPLPPTFSITWVLTGLVGPYLLYKTCRNLKLPTYASLSSLLVYITSTGFLSGFFMFFLPGKPLSSVVFLAICEYVTRREGDGVRQLSHRGYLYLWALILSGCFLDELFFAALALVPIIYWTARGGIPHFANRDRILFDIKLGLKVIAIPLASFLAIVLAVVPILTQKFYGYRLDYLGALSDTIVLANPLPPYRFGLTNTGWLAYTLLGVSLIPHQFASFVQIPGSGVETAQSVTIAGLSILGVWFFLAAAQLRRMEGVQRSRLILCILALLLLIVPIALMQGRHVPIVTGYYYGCIFSVAFALAFAVASSSPSNFRRAPWMAIAIAAVIGAIQLDNFFAINRSFVDYHNVKRPYEKATFEPVQAHPLTWGELSDIHGAWKAGRLPEYLKEHTVSDAAWYLLIELEHIDRLKKL